MIDQILYGFSFFQYVKIYFFYLSSSSFESSYSETLFCRVEYQSRPSISGVSSFKHILARLPPRVHSVYYRDEIGNISSSHLRTDSRKVLIFLCNCEMKLIFEEFTNIIGF